MKFIKKREISPYLWVDHCLCKVQQLEVEDKFIRIFFIRIVQFDVGKIFVQGTELWLILKTIWFNAGAFPKNYLPLLCFQKSLILSQWDTYTVYLVGSTLPTNRWKVTFWRSFGASCQWESEILKFGIKQFYLRV